MSVPFHSLYLNSQTREWSFHSLLLKLPNKEKEKIFLKYSYFSIPFHSIHFPYRFIKLTCITSKFLGYTIQKQSPKHTTTPLSRPLRRQPSLSIAHWRTSSSSAPFASSSALTTSPSLPHLSVSPCPNFSLWFLCFGSLFACLCCTLKSKYFVIYFGCISWMMWRDFILM